MGARCCLPQNPGGRRGPGARRTAGVWAALPGAAFSEQESLALTWTGGHLEMGAGRQSLGPPWVALRVACGLGLLERPALASGMMTPSPVPGGPRACSRVVDRPKQRKPESGAGVLWVLGTHWSTSLPGRQRTGVQGPRVRGEEGRDPQPPIPGPGLARPSCLGPVITENGLFCQGRGWVHREQHSCDRGPPTSDPTCSGSPDHGPQAASQCPPAPGQLL